MTKKQLMYDLNNLPSHNAVEVGWSSSSRLSGKGAWAHYFYVHVDGVNYKQDDGGHRWLRYIEARPTSGVSSHWKAVNSQRILDWLDALYFRAKYADKILRMDKVRELDEQTEGVGMFGKSSGKKTFEARPFGAYVRHVHRGKMVSFAASTGRHAKNLYRIRDVGKGVVINGELYVPARSERNRSKEVTTTTRAMFLWTYISVYYEDSIPKFARATGREAEDIHYMINSEDIVMMIDDVIYRIQGREK